MEKIPSDNKSNQQTPGRMPRESEAFIIQEIICKSSAILGLGMLIIIILSAAFFGDQENSDRDQNSLGSKKEVLSLKETPVNWQSNWQPSKDSLSLPLKVINEQSALEERGYSNIKEIGMSIYGCEKLWCFNWRVYFYSQKPQ